MPHVKRWLLDENSGSFNLTRGRHLAKLDFDRTAHIDFGSSFWKLLLLFPTEVLRMRAGLATCRTICHMPNAGCSRMFLEASIWHMADKWRNGILIGRFTLAGLWSDSPHWFSIEVSRSFHLTRGFPVEVSGHMADTWHVWHVSIADWFTQCVKPTQHVMRRNWSFIGPSVWTGFWSDGPGEFLISTHTLTTTTRQRRMNVSACHLPVTFRPQWASPRYHYKDKKQLPRIIKL
jgi:hypothetical protein